MFNRVKQIFSVQEVYHDPSLKNSQPKQVFTSAAASGILVNDLVGIMETKGSQGVVADTVGDNIFQWNVKLSNFEGTLLNEDLAMIKEEFGYDYIELQLDFSMDLYPFFPPLVKVCVCSLTDDQRNNFVICIIYTYYQLICACAVQYK